MSRVNLGLKSILVDGRTYAPTDGVSTANIKKAFREMALDLVRVFLGADCQEQDLRDFDALEARLRAQPERTIASIRDACSLPETKAYLAGLVEERGGSAAMIRPSTVLANLMHDGVKLLGCDVAAFAGETTEEAAARRAKPHSSEPWGGLFTDDRIEFSEVAPMTRRDGRDSRYFYADVPIISVLAALVDRAKARET